MAERFEDRHGPGIVLKYDDDGLRAAIEELRRVVERLRLERDYIRLFDDYLTVKRELRELDY